jgi:hypothetical protein
MDATDRRLWLRDSGVKVRAVRSDTWPPVKLSSGPLTAEAVPRVNFEQQGDVRVMIELGSLANLLSRA